MLIAGIVFDGQVESVGEEKGDVSETVFVSIFHVGVAHVERRVVWGCEIVVCFGFWWDELVWEGYTGQRIYKVIELIL